MKIAIHSTPNSFSDRWIDYCKNERINFKIVDCYSINIIEELKDCDALMWHFYHASPKATLFAKQLLYSLQASGIQVFPNFNTVWHFDDKIGQKYLMEALNFPVPKSYIFYDKIAAHNWAKSTTFPVVFKLRGGAGSVNVHLIKNRRHAIKVIRKAFQQGFKHDSQLPIPEIWRRYKLKKSDFNELLKGFLRILFPTEYSRVHGREKGYVYFQEFVPDNQFDIRVIVIGDKAFAIKRMTRENDFRASGSGHVLYGKENFDINTVALSFELSEKLNSQCVAFDYVYYSNQPLVLEISYGFLKEVYDPCEGYWDRNMLWHPGNFNPYGWIIDDILREIESAKVIKNRLIN